MAIGNRQPGLFDSGERGGGPYFLTNRHNLLRILAANLVLPHSGFAAKYYDDLLRLALGRLPILAGGASAEVCSMVTPEVESFPVMLELRRDALSDGALPALMADGTSAPAGLGNPDALMWAPTGALPFADVVSAIHFRSDRDRDEFELREYADVRPRKELHRVTPGLFEAAAPSADQVTTWLMSLDAVESPNEDGISAEDRRSGALVLGASTAPAEESELLGWGQLMSGKKPGRNAGQGVVRISRALERAKSLEPDEVALQVCLAILMSTNRLEVWRPHEVIRAVREGIQQQLKSNTDAMMSALDRAEAIVRGDEPFEGLKATGSPVMKALLLALLRPEPDRLLGWDPGGPGADETVLNLAAVLVGALTGRSFVPASMRGSALDRTVARSEAERLSAGRDRALKAAKPQPPKVERHDGSVVLILGKETVVERTISAPIAALMVTDELLQNGVVREAAIRIAVKMGWADSIESVVDAPTSDLQTSVPVEAGQPITMRFRGIGRIRYELIPSAFRAHAEGDDLLPEDVTALTQASPTA